MVTENVSHFLRSVNVFFDKFPFVDISSKNVNRKTDLCLQLLEVANVLDTPLGSFRTNILKELSPCLKREVKLNPGLVITLHRMHSG